MTNPLTWKESRFLGVPLTDDEIRQRGEQLADLIKEADALRVEHKARKEEMKEEIETIEGRIRHLAKLVNERVDERSVTVEIRYTPTLNMVEEVRTDTGEIIKTRSVTEEDKLRAQAQAQTSLLPPDES